jgi:hypothetical protein
MTGSKGAKLIQLPLIRVIFWIIMLVGVLIFWPAKAITEPEVIIETKFVYVYTEATLPEEFKDPEVIIEPKYGFSEDDIYLMTVLLCGSGTTDGDGEYDVDFHNKDNHGQVSLVLSVVMNRVMSDRFPNTVSEVIWAPGQFSPMPRWKQHLPVVSDKSYQLVKDWCEAYDKHDLSVMSIPESHLYFSGNGIINKSRERGD